MAKKTDLTPRAKQLLKGAGSVLDLYPRSPVRVRARQARPYKSDAEALYSDSKRVGADMWKALKTLNHE